MASGTPMPGEGEMGTATASNSMRQTAANGMASGQLMTAPGTGGGMNPSSTPFPLKTLEERCGKNEVSHRSLNLLPSPLREPNTAIFFRAFPFP